MNDSSKSPKVSTPKSPSADSSKHPDGTLSRSQLFIAVCLLALGAAVAIWAVTNRNDALPVGNDSSSVEQPAITNYDECAAAGYPIMESYPEQCSVPGGDTFTRDLTNTSDLSEPAITNYDECAAAGYPIMESYPEQCSVPGGDTFTRVITE